MQFWSLIFFHVTYCAQNIYLGTFCTILLSSLTSTKDIENMYLLWRSLWPTSSSSTDDIITAKHQFSVSRDHFKEVWCISFSYLFQIHVYVEQQLPLSQTRTPKSLSRWASLGSRWLMSVRTCVRISCCSSLQSAEVSKHPSSFNVVCQSAKSPCSHLPWVNAELRQLDSFLILI